MPRTQGAVVVQAMVQGVPIAWCEDNRLEYRAYSPVEVKRHASGKGNSKKPESDSCGTS